MQTPVKETIHIDTIIFEPALAMDYDTVIGMFSSTHDQDCCEDHELDFDSTKLDFETAKSFLSSVDKIEITGVEGMGINIRMYDKQKEFPIFVPGRGDNNGCYGDNINLIVTLPSGEVKEYDCTSYQNY